MFVNRRNIDSRSIYSKQINLIFQRSDYRMLDVVFIQYSNSKLKLRITAMEVAMLTFYNNYLVVILRNNLTNHHIRVSIEHAGSYRICPIPLLYPDRPSPGSYPLL